MQIWACPHFRTNPHQVAGSISNYIPLHAYSILAHPSPLKMVGFKVFQAFKTPNHPLKPYKSSILGHPHLWNPPYDLYMFFSIGCHKCSSFIIHLWSPSWPQFFVETEAANLPELLADGGSRLLDLRISWPMVNRWYYEMRPFRGPH